MAVFNANIIRTGGLGASDSLLSCFSGRAVRERIPVAGYSIFKGLTQSQLAQSSGLSTRMIQKYEGGISRPRYDASEKLAAALEVPITKLLGEDDMLVAQAARQYGSRGAKQAQELITEVTGLFAGGEMAEEDMDVMMKAITDAYWMAKEKNRKFIPRKYRKKGTI